MKKTQITEEQKQEIREYIENYIVVWTDFMDKIYTTLELSPPEPIEKSKELSNG